MSYLYLLLSAGCSLLLVHLMKAGEYQKQRMLNAFTVNYLVASIFAFGVGGFPPVDFWYEFLVSPLFLFAILAGAIFIGNFLVYSKSIDLNGMGVSVTAMRLSLLVPVLLSITFYEEELTPVKAGGLLLVILSLGLMMPKKKNIHFKKVDAAWLLVIIFLLTGLADASLKIYEEDFSLQINEMSFMGLVFFSAFVIGLISSISRKGPIVNKNEFITGALIGIPNLYSAVFLIYALRGIDGAVAYPVVNILNVAGGTILGLWIWEDTVTKQQWIGIGTAAAAILLLV